MIEVHSKRYINKTDLLLFCEVLFYLFDERIQFLLCVIDIYGKLVWVAPLKDKKRHYNNLCVSNNLTVV